MTAPGHSHGRSPSTPCPLPAQDRRHIVVVHLYGHTAVTHHRTHSLRHIVCPLVQPVIRAYNLQNSVVWVWPWPRRYAASSAGITTVVVELARIYVRPFLVGEFPDLAAAVPRRNPQRLVRSNRRVAADVLVVHPHHTR